LTSDGSVASSGGGAVVLDDGERIEYDWLVVAVGTASSDIGVPGAKAKP
jgi:NADH:ubiquinone reductase (non-electrogenic)